MRGHDEQTTHMFSYLSPEQRVPADHPLRAVRALTDEALDTEGRRAAVVVKLHEDIVYYEGHHLAGAAGRLDGREAQRKEELIPSSFAHSMRRYARRGLYQTPIAA